MFCKSRSLLDKYYGKLEWTKEVENFSSSREFLPRVENIFVESRIFLPSREQFLHVEF